MLNLRKEREENKKVMFRTEPLSQKLKSSRKLVHVVWSKEFLQVITFKTEQQKYNLTPKLVSLLQKTVHNLSLVKSSYINKMTYSWLSFSFRSYRPRSSDSAEPRSDPNPQRRTSVSSATSSSAPATVSSTSSAAPTSTPPRRA